MTITANKLDHWIELSKRFVRPIPEDTAYDQRLVEELAIISDQNFTKHFIRVLDVLELTKDIPHITRGSAGSSLVVGCWASQMWTLCASAYLWHDFSIPSEMTYPMWT